MQVERKRLTDQGDLVAEVADDRKLGRRSDGDDERVAAGEDACRPQAVAIVGGQQGERVRPANAGGRIEVEDAVAATVVGQA